MGARKWSLIAFCVRNILKTSLSADTNNSIQTKSDQIKESMFNAVLLGGSRKYGEGKRAGETTSSFSGRQHK